MKCKKEVHFAAARNLCGRHFDDLKRGCSIAIKPQQWRLFSPNVASESLSSTTDAIVAILPHRALKVPFSGVPCFTANECDGKCKAWVAEQGVRFTIEGKHQHFVQA
ncbi:hypothetical protein [Alterisphingorhabdus coralli]|uniref:Uncharacterized protein n=1 Tax=Alterisphingorhabdus coralli TaxID=3071408 RepID=A0AA97F7E3_9SPHN|nr:hypothetical protein [Parasphingorhabdus sp. SCSIO 66989]WOE75744.1 hypothetical protein RB602_03255 [Parasphingorhabdus sp. SCSIO 66989]